MPIARQRSGAALAREILDFSKPDADSGEHASVAQTLRGLDWMRHQLGQRRISYDVRTPPEGMRVPLGATRLEQVLSNLIANARDAVSDGGRISVAAEKASLRTEEAGGDVGLSLATAYQVVRRAGATVTVSSTVGAGTKFEVLLPLGSE